MTNNSSESFSKRFLFALEALPRGRGAVGCQLCPSSVPFRRSKRMAAKGTIWNVFHRRRQSWREVSLNLGLIDIYQVLLIEIIRGHREILLK